VVHSEDGRAELFDLAKDVGEERDLAADHPDQVAALRARLEDWRTAVGAQANTPNPAFDPALHKKLYVDSDVSKLKSGPTAAAMRPALKNWREGMNAVLPKKKK
jgi:hypothetical protein